MMLTATIHSRDGRGESDELNVFVSAAAQIGKNRMLAMVKDSPRSVSELRAKSDGPFVRTPMGRPITQHVPLAFPA